MTDESEAPVPSFEDHPLTRTEYISAMVHFYRGELTRANTWRLRLDTSTNWAILSSVGILSFAFGTRDHSHASILMAIVMVLLFLGLESRRYRFFDLWRCRLRMIEENFYGPLISRDLQSPESNWGKLMAHGLLHPEFKISFWQAFRARLSAHYMALFVILLAAWLSKLLVHPIAGVGIVAEMAVGPLPGKVVLVSLTAFYISLVGILVLVKKVQHPDLDFVSRRKSDIKKLPDF